jgi:hypothetical protein
MFFLLFLSWCLSFLHGVVGKATKKLALTCIDTWVVIGMHYKINTQHSL